MTTPGSAWDGTPRRIVLLDDDELIVRAVTRSLRAKNLVVEGTTNAKEAIAIVQKNAPDVVVSDLHMRDACGAQFLEQVADIAPPTMRVLVSADLEFRPRHGSLKAAAVHTLMNKSDLTALSVVIIEQLRARASEPTTHEAREELARRIARVLARPRHEDDGHRERLARFTTRIAQAMGLSSDAVREARLGAILHDVGHVTVPEQAFARGTPLAAQALHEIQEHPTAGARIVSEMPALRAALPFIASHHERQDGAGYPFRIGGEEIPKGVRAFQVADAYDSITRGRSYRARRTHGDAIAELRANAGRQHDADAVRALESLGEPEPVT